MEIKKKRDFKKGINLEDNRRKREESSLKLRKDSKCESLAKRRNLCGEVLTSPNVVITDQVIDFNLFLKGLQSLDSSVQANSLKAIRKALSVEKNPPVRSCIEFGIVPKLVEFLGSTNIEHQFEAAWALTNIASTEHTRYVVECNAIPPLISLLMSPNADVREQAAWCIGNIAGEGSDLRDFILISNALQPLLLNISQPASVSILRNCIWTLSNLCRGKPQPDSALISPALPVLSQIIRECSDDEAIVDAAWAISYLSDGDDIRIQYVLDLSVLPKLVNMISTNNTNMIVPALRAIGNIVSGNDAQTQAVIDAGALSALSNLLLHSKKSIRKETCWVLSNIAAGNQSQLNALFQTNELVSRVIRQLSSTIEWDVRKESAWVVCNLITSSTQSKLMQLIELGAISPLCDLLNSGDARIILITLDAIEILIRQSGGRNDITLLIEEAGGVDVLEKLQEHENVKIYEKVVRLLGKK